MSKLHSDKIKIEKYDGSLDSYQEAAITTAIYPGQGSLMGLVYTSLKLNGEAGEVAEKVGKVLRDDNGILTEGKNFQIALELGDVLWYIAASAKELGFTLEEIAAANLAKLSARQVANTLSGSGDNR